MFKYILSTVKQKIKIKIGEAIDPSVLFNTNTSDDADRYKKIASKLMEEVYSL
jgi:hypothetical protein